MADLGFLRGRGSSPQGGGANLLFGHFFAENCMKMKEIGPGWERAFLASPLNPLMHKHTEMAKMAVLVLQALSSKKCYCSEYWTWDLSHLDLKLSSLNSWGMCYLEYLEIVLCSCTWILDHLVRTNGDRNYKDLHSGGLGGTNPKCGKISVGEGTRVTAPPWIHQCYVTRGENVC